MSRLSRSGSAVGLALTALMVAAAPSYAGGGLQHCLDQAINHNGQQPTCVKQADGTWVASWPDGASGGGDGGFLGLFIVFAVLAVLISIAATVWRISTARRLARQSGMDPGLATQMTLLTENGLDATYLASSLRQPSPAAAAPPTGSAPARDASTRLAELKALLDQGAVTQAEYDARRQVIIDSV